MKMIKRLLGLTLAGAILVGVLSGCGEDAAQTPAPTPDPDDIAYQAAGISRETVLFTVDGADVTAGEYLFWLLGSINTAKQQYGYLADDEAWEEEILGVPTDGYLKSDALETTKLYALLELRAAEAGITISEEAQASLDSEIEYTRMVLEAQGYTLEDYLKSQCLSEEVFMEINQAYYLSMAYQEAMVEMDDASIEAFLDENGFYSCKHILLSTRRDTGETDMYGYPVYEDYSDEETAAVKEEADALLAQIRAAGDPLAEFDKVMNERSDDGRNEETGELYSPDGYNAYPGQMVSVFETTALSLEPGEISEPVKSDFGYHIILRLPQATDDETFRTYYQNNAMNQIIEQWLAEAEVKTTEAYDALDVKNFYDNMVAINEAAAASEDDPAPGESPSAEESPVPEG